MLVQNVLDYLEELAPLHYAESFDNVGLLTGCATNKVTGILVTLDTLESVVDEAIQCNCNLIVSFHPILFKGLTHLNAKNYVEKAIIKAIKNDIAIYAIHTALDNAYNGVAESMAQALGLTNTQVLLPKSKTIGKLDVHIPKENANDLLEKLFEVGAGSIGNYEHCSFSLTGEGTFMGNAASNPTLGKRGQLMRCEEQKIQVTFPIHLKNKLLKTMFAQHPYEEVAYEISVLENKNQQIGMGKIGDFPNALSPKAFLTLLKNTFKTGCVRYNEPAFKSINSIKKVAVLGGSGSFAIDAAMVQGADAYITADLKYHEFLKAENKLLLCDVGHFESEQFTKNLIVDFLKKKITNFAVLCSATKTNPINYF